MGSTTSTAKLNLGGLADRLEGQVVGPSHDDYDRQRAIWNGSIDRRPAVIARCANADDVRQAILFGRDAGLELAVRSGGHSFPGLSVVDDGMVIDLRMMNGVMVDPVARRVRVQAGALLGEMDGACQADGMAVPTGAVTHTGVAGLTLGGGIGWLMRRHGLSIDQLRSVDLVAADGEMIQADGERNPELFWGLRGGGGNFGIVTEFEFELHDVGPTVVSGMVFWDLEDGEEVSRFYRDWCADAPNDLTTGLVFRKAPAVDIVPQELHGRPVVGVIGCWAGDLDEGEAFWETLRDHGQPLLDLTDRRSYLDHQSVLDPGYPHGIWVYMKGCDVAELSDDIIADCVTHAARIEAPRSSVFVWQLGGAVADVAAADSAFSGREAGFVFNISGITEGAAGFDREREWVQEFWRALLPAQTSVYVNFLMDADQERIRGAYGARRFERLQALKRAYDPDNVFHLNQNIPPS